jgi:hypothetical protein
MLLAVLLGDIAGTQTARILPRAEGSYNRSVLKVDATETVVKLGNVDQLYCRHEITTYKMVRDRPITNSKV